MTIFIYKRWSYNPTVRKRNPELLQNYRRTIMKRETENNVCSAVEKSLNRSISDFISVRYTGHFNRFVHSVETKCFCLWLADRQNGFFLKKDIYPQKAPDFSLIQRSIQLLSGTYFFFLFSFFGLFWIRPFSLFSGQNRVPAGPGRQSRNTLPAYPSPYQTKNRRPAGTHEWPRAGRLSDQTVRDAYAVR